MGRYFTSRGQQKTKLAWAWAGSCVHVGCVLTRWCLLGAVRTKVALGAQVFGEGLLAGALQSGIISVVEETGDSTGGGVRVRGSQVHFPLGRGEGFRAGKCGCDTCSS